MEGLQEELSGIKGLITPGLYTKVVWLLQTLENNNLTLPIFITQYQEGNPFGVYLEWVNEDHIITLFDEVDYDNGKLISLLQSKLHKHCSQ